MFLKRPFLLYQVKHSDSTNKHKAHTHPLTHTQHVYKNRNTHREGDGRGSVCGCCKCLTMELRLAYVSFIHIFMQHTLTSIHKQHVSVFVHVCVCVYLCILHGITQHETLKYTNLIMAAAAEATCRFPFVVKSRKKTKQKKNTQKKISQHIARRT